MNYPLTDLRKNLTSYQKQLMLMKERKTTWTYESDIEAVEAIVKQYEDAIRLLEQERESDVY